jgi:shikimate kinase
MAMRGDLCRSGVDHVRTRQNPAVLVGGPPVSPARANPPTDRTIALIGLMGVGKSTVGRRLAQRLGLPFADGDAAIEKAAGMSVSEIFASLGEAEFRAGEARVMRRLLEGPPVVLATGGGAVLNPDTRALLKAHAITVWMRADLKTVAERVGRRDTRPLLRNGDVLETLKRLADARYPIYGEADVTVDVGPGSHAQAVEAILKALSALPARAGA